MTDPKIQYNLTYQTILFAEPCYDPSKYISEDWKGNLIDVLNVDKCNFPDRLWVVTIFIGDKLNRLFAVYCARKALSLIENPDSRSVEACDVAEKFAYGLASGGECLAANNAACRRPIFGNIANASDAAMDTAWNASRYIARDAAKGAARTAVSTAIRNADDYADENAASADYWNDFKLYLITLIKDELDGLLQKISTPEGRNQ